MKIKNDENFLWPRFWTHMFGSGIGELNVFVRSSTTGDDAKIWGLSGDAGNNWYMGQAPISSSSPFKVSQLSMVGQRPTADPIKVILSKI